MIFWGVVWHWQGTLWIPLINAAFAIAAEASVLCALGSRNTASCNTKMERIGAFNLSPHWNNMCVFLEVVPDYENWNLACKNASGSISNRYVGVAKNYWRHGTYSVVHRLVCFFSTKWNRNGSFLHVHCFFWHPKQDLSTKGISVSSLLGRGWNGNLCFNLPRLKRMTWYIHIHCLALYLWLVS